MHCFVSFGVSYGGHPLCCLPGDLARLCGKAALSFGGIVPQPILLWTRAGCLHLPGPSDWQAGNGHLTQVRQSEFSPGVPLPEAQKTKPHYTPEVKLRGRSSLQRWVSTSERQAVWENKSDGQEEAERSRHPPCIHLLPCFSSSERAAKHFPLFVSTSSNSVSVISVTYNQGSRLTCPCPALKIEREWNWHEILGWAMHYSWHLANELT